MGTEDLRSALKFWSENLKNQKTWNWRYDNIKMNYKTNCFWQCGLDLADSGVGKLTGCSEQGHEPSAFKKRKVINWPADLLLTYQKSFTHLELVNIKNPWANGKIAVFKRQWI